MADILDKDFKASILRILKELKENVEQGRKQCMNKMEISVEEQKT